MITGLPGVVGHGFPVSKVCGICGALLTSYSIGMAVLSTLIFPMGMVGEADRATGPSSRGIGLGALDCCLPCLLALVTFPGRKGFFLLTWFTPTSRFGNHH